LDSFTLNKIEFDAVRGVLAGFCASSLGREMAMRIGPSRTPQVINHWLTQVTQMVYALRDVGLPPLAGLADIAPQVQRTTPGQGASGEDFAAIAAALEALHNVRGYIQRLGENFETLHELAAGLADFAGEIAAIKAVVDPDGTVSDRASERLASLRRQIAETTERIRDVVYGYLRQGEVAKLLQNVAVTLVGDRYVLPVRVENRGRLPGVVHRASQTGATVYVEPEAVVELNNHLADLINDERREVHRLLSELALRVHPRTADITSSLRTAAHVDVLSAKAQYSYQFEMTCPTVTERGHLELTDARHPLLIERAHRQDRQSQAASPVVPINVRLGQDFDLLVITGSNTGGKTVALKTVALLAVMAQAGMHIPAARGATLPAFRDVFIDVGDEQSLQQSLSTFGAHIKRLRYILRRADKQCLVLLDELGSGTDPDEGGALGQAVLDELRSVGCLGMVTTHLSVLKAYAYNNERVDNASVEFDTETLSPTYHLRIGTPGESHAITVAQKLGLPRRLIGSARQYLSSQGVQFRRAIRATGQARQVAEEARAQAVQAQSHAQQQQEVYQAKLADLHRLQEEFNTFLARLPEMRAGDELFVPSLGKKASLVRLELHRQVALVDGGNMQVEVPLSELLPDLGQTAVREQISAIRQQILDQASAAQAATEQARRKQEEFQQSLNQQRERARQFDTWLSMIARVEVGDEVPIALKPGRGKLLSLDLPGLRAKVQTEKGEMEISLQDIFPQTGPFARYRQPPPTRQPRSDDQQRPPQRQPQRRPRRDQPPTAPQQHARPARHDRPAHTPRPAPAPEPEPDRPMPRRHADARQVQQALQTLLATQPGQSVYVVPFRKRATLIRLNEEKGLAVVQSGIFEMEIPLADIEPVR
jgi:DNA mismatch repair protein MutS2